MNYTPSDKKILKALADGDTYKQAAIKVCRAPGTVMKDLERLRTNYAARNTTHLIALAIKQGVI